MPVQLGLELADRCQITLRVEEALHDLRHTADDDIGPEVCHHCVVNITRNRRLVAARIANRAPRLFAHPDCPAELLKIQREHPELMDVPHGIRPDALELGPKHGPRECPATTAVLDKELGHRHDVRRLLHLVDKHEGIARRYRLSREKRHPANEIIGISRLEESVPCLAIFHEVELDVGCVVRLTELANRVALADLARTRDEQRLSFDESLPTIKLVCDFPAQHKLSLRHDK